MANSKLLIIVALASILAVTIPMMLSKSFQTEGSSRTTGCLVKDLSEVDEEYSFPIRQPNLSLIDKDAELQGIDDFRNVVVSYYSDFSICPFDTPVEKMMQDGLVKVTISTPDKHLKDSSDFQDQAYSYSTSVPGNTAYIQKLEVNGYKGIGWEPYDGNSVVRLKGEVIDSTPMHGAGAVKFYHEADKTIYFLSADRPLSEIIQIAESIK